MKHFRAKTVAGRGKKALGLIKSHFRDVDCLVLERCHVVHTFLLRAPIDIALVQEGVVVRLWTSVEPNSWRWVAGLRHTHVLEGPTGFHGSNGLTVGSHVSFDLVEG